MKTKIIMAVLALGLLVAVSAYTHFKKLEGVVDQHSTYINDVGYASDSNSEKFKELETLVNNHSVYINDVGYAVDSAHARIDKLEEKNKKTVGSK